MYVCTSDKMQMGKQSGKMGGRTLYSLEEKGEEEL